ncbi:MAG: DNA translocase FtsK 4TM domain-containing protein [Thermodesulfobacteriota bacterium]
MAKAKKEKKKIENQTSDEPSLGLRQEITGLVIGMFAVLVAVSLYSATETENRIGAVGNFISWSLGFSIGYAAYEVPFLCAILSIKLLLRRVINFYFWTIPGLVLLLLSSAGLLALFDKTEVNTDGGGMVGNFICTNLANYLGFAGALIVLATLLLIALITITGISFIQTVFVGFYTFIGFILSILSFLLSLVTWESSKKDKKKKSVKKKEPEIIAPEKSVVEPEKPKAKKPTPELETEDVKFLEPTGSFKLPPLSLLDVPGEEVRAIDKETIIERSKILASKLADFDVEGHVTEVRPGPIVTMYEFEPAAGIKVGKIVNLSNDLAMAMMATSIRIIAPIPGKNVVGIEVPNEERAAISFRELLSAAAFTESKSPLTVAIGKDIGGIPNVADLKKMPHLLIAGATGSGKSVFVNSLILSILYKANPEDVRFIMIDPKMLELSSYEGIPHLLTPVITDAKKASAVLRTMVAEMGKRYKLIADLGGKSIESYNELVAALPDKPEPEPEPDTEDEENTGETPPPPLPPPLEHKKLPYIVIVIDELADLMMTSGKEVEESIVRLSQMARAAGIHLIVATQRPSVDVITGLIKTNFPARISFKVPSKTDSRTILDSGGAETLLGNGDMLMMPPGTSKLIRIHGPYVSEIETKKIATFLKEQGSPTYNMEIAEAKATAERAEDDSEFGEEFMRRYDEAVEMAMDLEMISTSYVQRRFRIGYNSAARIIEKMEADGIIGPPKGSKPREVLKRNS